MEHIYVPYIVVEIFLFLNSLVILFRLNTNLGSMTEVRLLKCVIHQYCIVLLADIVWAFNEDSFVSLPHLALAMVNGVSLVAMAASCYFWYRYVEYRLEFRLVENKIYRAISAAPIVAAAVLDVISIFTGWTFFVDADGHYVRSWLYWFQSLVCYAYLIIPTVSSLIMVVKSKSKGRRGEFLMYAAYMIPSMISFVLQDYVGIVPLLYLSMYMIVNMLFLRIQNVQIYNDALTGLYNRRRLNQYLDDRLRAASTAEPVLVFLMDVNKFKKINDSYGHVEGDRALQVVAQALKKAADRHGAFVARYGGDEFCVVCSRHGVDTAEQFAAECSDELAGIQKNGRQTDYTISLGMGWAECADPLTSSEQAFKRADEELYKNKKQLNSV